MPRAEVGVVMEERAVAADLGFGAPVPDGVEIGTFVRERTARSERGSAVGGAAFGVDMAAAAFLPRG